MYKYHQLRDKLLFLPQLSKSIVAEHVVVASIIFCSMLLASYWVFLIPIFQSPDEECHADYIFTLYSRKKLFQATEAPLVVLSHPYMRYLVERTNDQALKLTRFAQLPANYGSQEFFKNINDNAPQESSCTAIKTNPVLVAVNPAVYYVIVAAWLRLLSVFNNSLTFLYFSARFLSVILLGSGLLFSYLTMRELGISAWRSALILAAIGFFPLVSFIGSYIQPDNLSFAVISLGFFLSLYWRNRINKSNCKSQDTTIGSTINIKNLFKTTTKLWFSLFLLGLAMALLLVKYQFFCCVGISVLAMILTKCIHLKISPRKIAIIFFILLFPSIIIGAIQMWVSWHSHLPPQDNQHWHWFPVTTTFEKVLHSGWIAFFSHVLGALLHAYQGMFSITGRPFVSFWGLFGHLLIPLVIISRTITEVIKIIIICLTYIIILLTLASLLKIFISLFRLIKKGRFFHAIYIASSNPVLNSYFLFILFWYLFYVLVEPSFEGQGRQWLPIILGIFINATYFAPHIFASKVVRQRTFFILTISWLCYSLVGAYWAIQCVHKRYYAKKQELAIDLTCLKPAYINVPNFINWLEYLDHCPTFDLHPRHNINYLVVPKGEFIWIQGWAADLKVHVNASAVFLFIDNDKIYRAAYGLGDEADKTEYPFSGFGTMIPTTDLPIGNHYLTMKFVSADKKLLYSTNQKIKITIK